MSATEQDRQIQRAQGTEGEGRQETVSEVLTPTLSIYYICVWITFLNMKTALGVFPFNAHQELLVGVVLSRVQVVRESVMIRGVSTCPHNMRLGLGKLGGLSSW